MAIVDVVPEYEVVLFDIDGTLVDHDGALRDAVCRWLTGGHLATQEQCDEGLVALWDDVAERHFPAFRAGEISFQEQRRRRLREFLPHLHVRAERMGDQELDAIFGNYLTHYEGAWRAYDDVVPCLSALLGVRLAVLSNGDQSQQADKLRRTGLATYFEAVLTSGELGAAKPYPDAFHRACQRLRAEPRRVLYVGDRLDVDARAASAAGLSGVWLNRSGSDSDPGQPTIASLRELPLLLGRAIGERS